VGRCDPRLESHAYVMGALRSHEGSEQSDALRGGRVDWGRRDELAQRAQLPERVSRSSGQESPIRDTLQRILDSGKVC
jgi:hypothetical protein